MLINLYRKHLKTTPLIKLDGCSYYTLGIVF